MKKKAKKKAAKGKAKTSRKRSATKDLSARKAAAVKGGLLQASTFVPAVQHKVVGDGSVLKITGNVSYK
jgi:hypothetical protein